MKLSIEKVFPFVSESIIQSMANVADARNALLERGKGKGNDFLGWVNLLACIYADTLDEISSPSA